MIHLHSCHSSLFSLCFYVPEPTLLMYHVTIFKTSFRFTLRKWKCLENENMSHSILRNWVKLYFGKLSDRSLIKDGFYIKLERLNVRMIATILYPTLFPSMSARNWIPPFQVSLLPDCSFWLSSSSTIKTFHLPAFRRKTWLFYAHFFNTHNMEASVEVVFITSIREKKTY